MSFTTYNQINAPHKPRKYANGLLTLYMSSYGTFRLSQRASEILKLTDKDKIVFLQDNDYPTDWYVQKDTDKFGFPLHANNKGNLSFQSCTLKDLLLKTVVKDKYLQFRSIRFLLTPKQGRLAVNINGYHVAKVRKNG